MTHRTILIGIVLFFFLSACTKQIQPMPSPSVHPLDASLEELLALYRHRLEKQNSLKALVEIKTDLGRRGIHTFQAAWRVQNDHTKIRVFDLFGGTLFELGLNSSVFSIKIPSEQKRFEGNLESFDELAGEKIPFGSLDLFVWVNRGGIPNVISPTIPVLEKQDEFFILYLFLNKRGIGTLVEKIWIERTAFRVKKVELFDRSGMRRGIVELNDYRKIDGRDFPFFIKGSGQKETIELSFREVSFPEVPFPEVPFLIDRDGR